MIEHHPPGGWPHAVPVLHMRAQQDPSSGELQTGFVYNSGGGSGILEREMSGIIRPVLPAARAAPDIRRCHWSTVLCTRISKAWHSYGGWFFDARSGSTRAPTCALPSAHVICSNVDDPNIDQTT